MFSVLIIFLVLFQIGFCGDLDGTKIAIISSVSVLIVILIVVFIVTAYFAFRSPKGSKASKDGQRNKTKSHSNKYSNKSKSKSKKLPHIKTLKPMKLKAEEVTYGTAPFVPTGKDIRKPIVIEPVKNKRSTSKS